MRAYKFSLEKVLEWRSDEEKRETEKFAVIQRDLQKENSILNNLVKEYSEAKKKILSCKSIQSLQQQSLYITTLEEQIEEQMLTINRVKERLEAARIELLYAQKDRKVVEKLKEKDLEVYTDNVKSQAQKEMDEAAILGYKGVPSF